MNYIKKFSSAFGNLEHRIALNYELTCKLEKNVVQNKKNYFVPVKPKAGLENACAISEIIEYSVRLTDANPITAVVSPRKCTTVNATIYSLK